jgi:hypothetical protein
LERAEIGDYFRDPATTMLVTGTLASGEVFCLREGGRRVRCRDDEAGESKEKDIREMSRDVERYREMREIAQTDIDS